MDLDLDLDLDSTWTYLDLDLDCDNCLPSSSLYVANIFSLKDVSVHEQSLLTGIQGLANWTLLWTMETMETQTIDN